MLEHGVLGGVLSRRGGCCVVASGAGFQRW